MKIVVPKLVAAALYLALIIPFGVISQARVDNPATSLVGAELLKELRLGGYSLYFRHGITDHGKKGNRKFTYSAACLEQGECGACDQQRGLNKAGRKQSQETGEFIQALNIPIGIVVASPLCRTMDTANLMFGRAEPSVDVRDGGLGPTSHPRLRNIVAKAIPRGTNQAISGHSGQFQLVTGGEYHLEEGEVAVIKGYGNGEFKILAQIPSQNWQSLKALTNTQ